MVAGRRNGFSPGRSGGGNPRPGDDHAGDRADAGTAQRGPRTRPESPAAARHRPRPAPAVSSRGPVALRVLLARKQGVGLRLVIYIPRSPARPGGWCRVEANGVPAAPENVQAYLLRVGDRGSSGQQLLQPTANRRVAASSLRQRFVVLRVPAGDSASTDFSALFFYLACGVGGRSGQGAEFLADLFGVRVLEVVEDLGGAFPRLAG